MHSGHGHSASVSRLSNYNPQYLDEEDDGSGEALTPTPARRITGTSNDNATSGISEPNSATTRKRYSGIGQARRISSGPGEMGPPERRSARKLSGVGETF